MVTAAELADAPAAGRVAERTVVLAFRRRLCGGVDAIHLVLLEFPATERGGEPPSIAREARDVLAVIEAAYESARTGARVELAATSASA